VPRGEPLAAEGGEPLAAEGGDRSLLKVVIARC